MDYRAAATVPDRPIAVGDALLHALEHLQLSFMRECVYAEDDFAAHEAVYDRQAELAMGEVAVKHRQLGRFDKTLSPWRYFSHGRDGNALLKIRSDNPHCVTKRLIKSISCEIHC